MAFQGHKAYSNPNRYYQISNQEWSVGTWRLARYCPSYFNGSENSCKLGDRTVPVSELFCSRSKGSCTGDAIS